MHRVLPALTLLLAVVSVAAAGIPTKFYYVTVTEGGKETKYLTAREGKLTLSEIPATTPQAEDAPFQWYVLGTQVKACVDGS